MCIGRTSVDRDFSVNHKLKRNFSSVDHYHFKKKSTLARYWVLAILLSPSFVFSACNKDKDEPALVEISEEKDPRLILIRDRIMKLENYDLTGIKPDIRYSDFSQRDGVGPFKGEDFFSIGMVKSFDPTKMRLLNHADTKPYVILQFIFDPVAYMAFISDLIFYPMKTISDSNCRYLVFQLPESCGVAV